MILKIVPVSRRGMASVTFWLPLEAFGASWQAAWASVGPVQPRSAEFLPGRQGWSKNHCTGQVHETGTLVFPPIFQVGLVAHGLLPIPLPPVASRIRVCPSLASPDTLGCASALSVPVNTQRKGPFVQWSCRRERLFLVLVRPQSRRRPITPHP